MKQRVLRGSFLVLFLCGFLLLSPENLFSKAKEGFNLSIPLSEGIEAEKKGDFDKAIESYRKVLFIDGADLSTQFRLADALLKNEKPTKAYKEFKIFLKNAKDSKRLKEEDKQKMIQYANEIVGKVEKDHKGLELLTFMDFNILIVAFFLTLVFLYQSINFVFSFLDRVPEDEKNLKGIWTDPYWKQQEEREFGALPQIFFSLGMFFVLVLFYFLSYQVIQKLV